MGGGVGTSDGIEVGARMGAPGEGIVSAPVPLRIQPSLPTPVPPAVHPRAASPSDGALPPLLCHLLGRLPRRPTRPRPPATRTCRLATQDAGPPDLRRWAVCVGAVAAAGAGDGRSNHGPRCHHRAQAGMA
eukprot:scaffold4219_cov103-Isochrysis_galbana.AAC.3